MHPNAPRRVPAVLDVIPFPAPPGDLAWFRCADCSTSLELHQPDNEFPDRLLGVCKSCRRWTLIELAPDGPGAVMALLPEGGWALNAVRDHAPTPPPTPV
jgi:hypothetical protein